MANNTPVIQTSQTTLGTLTGDRRILAGEEITAIDTNPNNVGGTRQWALLWKPPTSSATVTESTSNTAKLTASVPGTHVLECVYRVGRKTWRYYVYLSVLYPNSNTRMPAAGEGGTDSRSYDDGGGDDYGWWGAIDSIAQTLEAIFTTGITPSGDAGGDLDGTYPDPTVTHARGLREAGGQSCAMASVTAGEVLYRNGNTIDGLSRIAIDTTAIHSGDTVAGIDSTAIHSGDAAGGSLGGTYPNPTVTKITETGGPTTLTLGAVADGQALVRSGSSLVGRAPGATTYAYHDTRPSYLGAATDEDVEFGIHEPSDRGYTYSVTPSGTPSHFVLNTSGAPKALWKGAARAGHGAVQPNDATYFICTKGSLTLASQEWFWFRNLIDNQAKTQPTSTNTQQFVLLLADASGNNNVVVIGGPIDWAGVGDFSALFYKTTATATGSPTGLAWANAFESVDEILIQKDGTDYHMLAKTILGWKNMGKEVHSTTFTKIQFSWFDDSGPSPGNAIHYPKFFRRGSGLLTSLPG